MVCQKEEKQAMSDEMIIRHCSPTLAGLTTGSLFSCEYTSEREVKESVQRLNQRLRPRGLRVLPMRIGGRRALIYLYRPARLRRDLESEEARSLLAERGYPCDDPDRCVVQLARRLRAQPDFPHEIGVFLGYPPEDVRGFIENGAKCCKCVGCWKVYGDVQAAQKRFAQFRKCNGIYRAQWESGKLIEKLAVASH